MLSPSGLTCSYLTLKNTIEGDYPFFDMPINNDGNCKTFKIITEIIPNLMIMIEILCINISPIRKIKLGSETTYSELSSPRSG
jgi:hypothetical protein